MKFLLPFVMFVACDAHPSYHHSHTHAEDLTGKMFTFAQQTNTYAVTLMPSDSPRIALMPKPMSYSNYRPMAQTPQDSIAALTVCLRAFTDLTSRHHALFSLAVPGDAHAANAFLIFAKSTTQIALHVSHHNADFDQEYTVNTWHSVCATWNSKTHLGQVWVDGKPSMKKLIPSSAINGNPSIIVGQDQDRVGGGFAASQSFVGMMTDVHMWNSELPPCEIKKYMDNLSFKPGNVINWRDLKYEIAGEVVLDEYCAV